MAETVFSWIATMTLFSKQVRRRHLLAEPFPEEWRPLLHQSVLLYQLLPESEQLRLCEIVRILIAEKYWEGCAGLEITEEIQLTVAANAGILLFGFDDYYFDELQTILLYPGGFLRTIDDPLGHDERSLHLLGEAHQKGPVVLSWWHTRWDSRRLGKNNLVIHEFAHKLAELGDPLAGVPRLHDDNLADRWDEIVEPEFERLAADARYDRPALLDTYGATNRAEFFAVASECFFLQPAALKRRHPALYQLLADFYNQDPGQWKTDQATTGRARLAETEYARHVIDECSAAIRLFPDSVEAYRGRADSYEDLGEWKSALADRDAVIRLLDGDEKAIAYYERGMTYMEAESLDQAIADFNDAIRRLPDFAAAYRSRGTVYAAKGNREQALADLNRTLHLDPDDDTAYRERAQVLFDSGRSDKALRDLSRAIRLAPSVEDAYRLRAEIYIATEEYERAIADLSQVVRIDPDDAEARSAMAQAQKALGKKEPSGE
jgi:Mlc titration factor MtfA (ptsG expression regulator)/Tfp pilus assembly protein PilF